MYDPDEYEDKKAEYAPYRRLLREYNARHRLNPADPEYLDEEYEPIEPIL